MLGLCLFASRRTLPAWLLVGFLALLLLAARGPAGPPLLEADGSGRSGLEGLARQNAWSVLFVLAPLLFLQAARLGSPAAGAWLAPTPARPAWLAVALASGCFLAAGAATALAALVSEAAAGASSPAWRRAGALESPPAVLLDQRPSLRWSVPCPTSGQRLRVWTTVALGSGPAVTARFTARAGALSTKVERRVAGRSALELEPPQAPGGTLELELERVGPGALLVLPPHALELLEPVASTRLTALAFGSRALAFLVTGSALSFGLASRMRAGLAAALVLALALLSWTSASAARLVPGGDLALAWQDLGSGLVPAWAPPSSFAGGLVLVLLGLALRARPALERGSPA